MSAEDVAVALGVSSWEARLLRLSMLRMASFKIGCQFSQVSGSDAFLGLLNWQMYLAGAFVTISGSSLCFL